MIYIVLLSTPEPKLLGIFGSITGCPNGFREKDSINMREQIVISVP
jgi:hypothetical protein